MPEWTFQRKLITGVIAICLLAILTSAASLFASRVLIVNTDVLSNGVGQDLQDAKNLQLSGIKKIADVRACLLTRSVSFESAARAGSSRVRELAAVLRSRVGDPEVRLLLDRVLNVERTHEEAFERELNAARSTAVPMSIPSLEGVLERGARFDQSLTALVQRVEATSDRSLAASRTAVNRAEDAVVIVTIATILLLVFLCLVLIAVLNRSYLKQTVALATAQSEQSEARATLTEVEAASHLKDEFLATVSHELRNPLAPILTWTQLLRSGTLDEAKTQRALEVIERNVLSQAQLIDDLVDVSRVVAGKFRLDVRPLDLMPIIKVAAESQQPAAEAKQIRMQLVLDERAGRISGDSERLQQVMWNLMSNAIKFTGKGGTVQVVLQRVESHVEIVVRDTGIGIDADFLPHVFEPFRQGTGGPMRRHSGLGLGLSIVRHIVELHGGEITAASEGAGQGSKFVVEFPLLATVEPAAHAPSRHPIARDSLANLYPAQLDGIRVLVVDDEPSASEALMVMFNACGAQARVAGSCKEALDVFDAWRPDVLVSDIAMPGEDGYSLIRKVRARRPEDGGQVPAVALTAYAKIEDRVSILGAGFQMYLSKPADPNELIAVVDSLVKRGGTELRTPVL